MDIFTREELMTLVTRAGEPCLSFFLPTHRTAPDSHGNPTRFRNLIRAALEQAVERGYRRANIESLLQPAHRRLDDNLFWTHQSDGLAVFLAEGFERWLSLPRSFTEEALVGKRFSVNPLVSQLQFNGRYFILAVSRNVCRLLQGTRHTVQEVNVKNLPYDLKSALGWYEERHLNYHSVGGAPRRGPGGNQVVFHGHEDQDKGVDVAAYFRKIDTALHPILNLQKAPLVFAGTEELFPIFKEASTYPHLVGEPAEGSPDDMKPRELHAKTWPLVEPIFAEREEASLARIEAGRADERISEDISEILRAARDGLVETLYLTEGVRRWGSFDEQSGETSFLQPEANGRPGKADDLLELATSYTLRNGGNVLAFEAGRLPDQAEVAAALRSPRSTIVGTAAGGDASPAG